MTSTLLDWLAIGLAPGEMASAQAEFIAKEAVAHASSLCVRYRDARLLLLSVEPVMVAHRSDDRRLIVLGTIHAAGVGEEGRSGGGAARLLEEIAAPATEPLGERLVRRAWGSYVALWDEDGDERLLVDPSGSRPAMISRFGPLSVAAPDFPFWLWRAVGATPSIFWGRVAASMVRSVVPTHEPLLDGIQLATPGKAVSLVDPARDVAPSWSPTIACRRQPGGPVSANALRAVVESTVLRQAGGRATLVQLSGGLDSSIVLSCLAKDWAPGRLTAFTMATRHAGGDERDYAALVADAFSVRLESCSAPERPIDHRRWLEIEHGVRPYLYGLDDGFEQAIAATAADAKSELVMTGQGGDAVFFEMPTPKVTADRVRRDGWRALLSSASLADAERCNVSMWSLLRAVLADRLGMADRPPALLAPDLLTTDAQAALSSGVPVHPWIREAVALAPARRLQIEAIANAQIFFAPRPVSGAVPIAHPLLAQPVVDHVLSLSTADLCFGTGDRALARKAFAERLPGRVVQRQVKGEASAHYSRAILSDLPALRSMLLDGPLVTAGILDRAATERAMDPRTLVFGDAFRALSLYASLSAWVAYWQRSI